MSNRPAWLYPQDSVHVAVMTAAGLPEPRIQKDGPKRRRRTPRDKTAVSRQGFMRGCMNFKRERIAKLVKIEDREQS